MTMAHVENNQITEVGLPEDLRGKPIKELAALGWTKVVGQPMPENRPSPGYHWTYGESWVLEDGVVYGEWSETQRPQPYPSWSWVDGEGWVPPTPKPEGNYVWDEESQSWVEDTLV